MIISFFLHDHWKFIWRTAINRIAWGILIMPSDANSHKEHYEIKLNEIITKSLLRILFLCNIIEKRKLAGKKFGRIFNFRLGVHLHHASLS